MDKTLVILAAGMGSRYGGLKQIDGLGPNGETIIDYSIYDAVQAGFGKVVYIVREYFREQMEAVVKEKYSNVKCIDGEPLEFQFVTQELHKIPSQFTLNPDREKPWGTAHAVLMGKEAVKEPFVHTFCGNVGHEPPRRTKALQTSTVSSLLSLLSSVLIKV